MSIAKQLRVLLPYEKLEYRTTISSAEVIERLGKVIEPFKFRFFGIGDKPYEGAINGYDFTVERILRGRRINPIITGKIVDYPEGACVCISIQLDQMAAVLIVPLVFISAIMLIIGLWGVPIFFAVFFYVTITLQFKYEAEKSKRFFTYLLGVESVQV